MSTPELQPQQAESPKDWAYENWSVMPLSFPDQNPLESAAATEKFWGPEMANKKLIARAALPVSNNTLDKSNLKHIPTWSQQEFLDAEAPERTWQRRAGRSLLIFEDEGDGQPLFFVGSAEAFKDIRLGDTKLYGNPGIKMLSEGDTLFVGREGWLPHQAREEENRPYNLNGESKRVISRKQAVFEVKDGQLNLFTSGKNKMHIEAGEPKRLGQKLIEASQADEQLATEQVVAENRVLRKAASPPVAEPTEASQKAGSKPPLAARKKGKALEEIYDKHVERITAGDVNKSVNEIQRYANASADERWAIDRIHTNYAAIEEGKRLAEVLEQQAQPKKRSQMFDLEKTIPSSERNAVSPEYIESGLNETMQYLGKSALYSDRARQVPSIFNQTAAALVHDPFEHPLKDKRTKK
jgi:hypothetical protein